MSHGSVVSDAVGAQRHEGKTGADKPPARRLSYLPLWISTTLVLVHPLIDFLARQPEFFLAQHLRFGTLVLGTVGLTLLAPVPLALLRAALAAASSKAADRFDALIVGSTAAVFLLQAGHASFLKSFDMAPLALLVAVVVFVVGRLWLRAAASRTFFLLLAPAVILVPLLFLVRPEIRALANDPVRPPPLAPNVVADSPIVFIVFDALSASAVMDADRTVNRIRFPALASLADDSLWFTNVLSLAHMTTEALPSVLTGQYPKADGLPNLEHYPKNLFTALAASHRIVASEPVFRFCPPELNHSLVADPGDGHRFWHLTTDLLLVYLHLTLPPAFTRTLPSVTEGWGDFLHSNSASSPPAKFQRFVDALEPHPDPTLYYLHAVFPHKPYFYLPSGRTYRWQTDPYPDLSRALERRAPDLETQIFVYKQYLLQVAHLDHLVGQLVERLKETDLYERSLIVITSDHGSRTAPFNVTNDMRLVPLLIKLPHQSKVGVRRERVSNLDILPSLLDLLGAPQPWAMDGRSFFVPGYEPPDQVFLGGDLVPATEELWEASSKVVDFKIEHFGLGEDPLLLFRAGCPVPELLGVPVDQLTINAKGQFSAQLDRGESIITVKADADFVPALLLGSLFFDDSTPRGAAVEPPTLLPRVALSVNGVVEAVSTVRLHEKNWYRFRFTVPETAFPAGDSRVEVWLVDADSPTTLYGPL